MAIDRSGGASAFADLLDTVDPTLQPICQAIRNTLAEVHAGFVEVVWHRQRIASYGIGPKKLSEHYAFIAPLPGHVKFGFYRGAFLNDPNGLLTGKGPRSRHAVLIDADAARSEALKHLIRQAISERLASRP